MRLDDYYSGLVHGARSKGATPPTHREAQRDYDQRVRQMRITIGVVR